MGTRADFYVGRGESAEWLGSIAWDGYPGGINKPLLKADTEKKYRAAVVRFFADREDVTRPVDGWPWPWENSLTTDYAYAFDDGKVWASPFGHGWFDPLKDEPEDDRPKSAVFPNMKAGANVQIGGKRSGLIVIGT